jgi:hypothetical protein
MIFTQDSTVQDALKLPVGKIIADSGFGFYAQGDVSAASVEIAAKALLDSGKNFSCSTQAQVMVAAQKLTAVFETWNTLIAV